MTLISLARHRVRLASAAVLLASFVVTAAHAQDEPQIGSRIASRHDIATPVTGALVLVAAHDWAECAVNHRYSAVLAYLDAADVKNQALSKRTLFRPIECNDIVGASDSVIQRGIGMPDDLQRGMLAEAVLKEKAGGVVLPAAAPAKSYGHVWSAVSGRDPSVDEMAACAATTDPAHIGALLATQPGSAKEKAGVASLVPTLGNCLVQGAKLNANAQSLRAALAEALYHRWASSQPAQSASAR